MLSRLRKYFVSGLVVFLPFALTVFMLVKLIAFAESFLGSYLRPFFAENFGFYFWGLGIIAGIYIIVLIGFFVTNFVGRRVFEYFETLLIKLPFFRQVYPAIKEMAVFLFSTDRFRSFRQVVIIEYPRKGLYSFGFLTNDTSKRIHSKIGKDLVNVFIPSAPGPLTGYVIMVPRRDVIIADITVEEAVKFILSGGVVNPV